MIVLAVNYIIVACFFYRYTLALLRFMLFNCNSSNYMLLWFFPLGLLWFFTMHASCFVYPQCSGLSRCYDQGPMHFCKALSWKSLWIKASAKCKCKLPQHLGMPPARVNKDVPPSAVQVPGPSLQCSLQQGDPQETLYEQNQQASHLHLSPGGYLE